MKRALILMLTTVVGAGFLAAFSMNASAINAPEGGGGGGAANAAADPFLGCKATSKDPCKCPAGEVQIALPLSGTDKCVDNTKEGGAIFLYLKTGLKFLSGAVAVVIILMLVLAGVQLISSAGDPGAIKAAKTRVQNAILALLLFLMMFAIINFLVPGGLFSA